MVLSLYKLLVGGVKYEDNLFIDYNPNQTAVSISLWPGARGAL